MTLVVGVDDGVDDCEVVGDEVTDEVAVVVCDDVAVDVGVVDWDEVTLVVGVDVTVVVAVVVGVVKQSSRSSSAITLSTTLWTSAGAVLQSSACTLSGELASKFKNLRSAFLPTSTATRVTCWFATDDDAKASVKRFGAVSGTSTVPSITVTITTGAA